MNIEQLEKGTELRQRIKEVNNAQKSLIENYKKGKSRKQLYISFDGNRGDYYGVGEKIFNQIFDLVNGYLVGKITELEKEFDEL